MAYCSRSQHTCHLHEKNLPIDGLILSQYIGFSTVYTLLTISQFKGVSLQFRNLSPSYCLSMQLCQTEKNSALLRRFPRRWAPTSNWLLGVKLEPTIEYIRSFTSHQAASRDREQKAVQGTLSRLQLPCHPRLGSGSSRTIARGTDADP